MYIKCPINGRESERSECSGGNKKIEMLTVAMVEKIKEPKKVCTVA